MLGREFGYRCKLSSDSTVPLFTPLRFLSTDGIDLSCAYSVLELADSYKNYCQRAGKRNIFLQINARIVHLTVMDSGSRLMRTSDNGIFNKSSTLKMDPVKTPEGRFFLILLIKKKLSPRVLQREIGSR